MTARVAFVGDSHLACLALAARSMDLGRIRPTFFAHVLRRLEALQVSGGRLHAGNEDLRHVLRGTSGGSATIDPQCFDLFVLMGLELELPFQCLWQQHYSRAVTEQTVRDQLSSSLAFSTLAKLRQITARPVWLLHAPLADSTRGTRRPEVLTYNRFLDLANEVFQPLAASVLPQPAETRIDDLLGRPEFSRSPVRLEHATGAPLVVEPDYNHKSEAFGRAILRDLRNRLETFQRDEEPKDAALNPWRPCRLGTVIESDSEDLLLGLRAGDDGVRLNATAAAIWQRCDGTRSESELLVELSERFGAPEERLRCDLRGALERLVGVGALEPEHPPAVHPLTHVDEGHLGGYIRASSSLPGCNHGDPQTWEPDVWKWAVSTFAAESVLDVGCGEGHSTRFLHDLGCRVLGVDGSVQAKESSALPERHVRHDFVDGPFIPHEGFDLVWSCEFVEHVEERFADHFLTTFGVARKAILMTFADPGQPGWHHVNCQPENYWVEKIERLGFRLDRKLTDRSRAVARGVHFARKGLVFVRQG